MGSRIRKALLACLVAAMAIGLGARHASAQPASTQGTDYLLFWRGDLRIIATRPNTEVTIVDASTGANLAGGYTSNIAGNPFVLSNAGDSFEANNGTTTFRIHVTALRSTGPPEAKPIIVWTGALDAGIKHPAAPPTTWTNAWVSNVPVLAPGSVENGTEIGREFWGFTSKEMLVVARRDPATPTSISIDDLVTNVEADSDDTQVLDATSSALLYQDAEVELYWLDRFEDDTFHLTSNVDVSVTVGIGARTTYDWTITPPSFGAGEDARELGTLFYTFVARDLTVFPTQDNTTVTITDLADADDSGTFTLPEGNLTGGYDILLTDTFARNGTGVTPRPSGPAVTLDLLGPSAPFENDLVKVEADRPVLLYVGPKSSDTSEYADVAYAVRTGPSSWLSYCYAQNGGAEDFQVFAYDPATNITITSLTYTTGFRNNGQHDFQIPSVTPWLGGNATTNDWYWASGIWNGELLRVQSDGPITIIDGDYDGPNFGCFIPFVADSGLLLPIADAGPDLSLCPGISDLTLDGRASFDADSTTGSFTPRWTWDLDASVDSDGDGSPTNDVDLVGSLVTTALPGAGPWTITLTYHDDDGQTDTDVLVVNAGDVTAPALSCPSVITATGDASTGAASVSVLASATDDCDARPVVTNDRTPGGADAGDTYPCGPTLVTFTARDASGNSATCQTQVSVVDATAPVLSCAASVAATADATGAAFVVVTASVADNCDPSPVVTNDRTAGGTDASDAYPCGVTVVTFGATDASGNAAACVTTVTVADGTAPVPTCPGTILADADATGAAFVTVVASAVDNCDPSPVLANDRTAGGADASDTYPCGATVVTFGATDASGNGPATCTTTVLVADVTAPAIACPARIDQPADSPLGASVVVLATSSDACDPDVPIANDRTAGGADASDVYPCGVTLVTFTGTDDAGNVGSCTTTVNVFVPLPPVGISPALRVSKVPGADQYTSARLHWETFSPRPWEHFEVRRTTTDAVRPYPVLYADPLFVATLYDDLAAPNLLDYYQVYVVDCSGVEAPDVMAPSP